MKKLFISCIQLLMSALLITGSASAQKSLARASVSTTQTIEPSSPNPEFSTPTGADVKDINLRAVRHFNRDYKTASNPVWLNSEKTITASFNENGISNTVVYHKNGRWLHTLRNYDESHLPDAPLSIIKDNFRNYDIKWVTEVHEGDKTMYFINIQNNNRLKQVYVCDGEYAIYKDLKLAK